MVERYLRLIYDVIVFQTCELILEQNKVSVSNIVTDPRLRERVSDSVVFLWCTAPWFHVHEAVFTKKISATSPVGLVTDQAHKSETKSISPIGLVAGNIH